MIEPLTGGSAQPRGGSIAVPTSTERRILGQEAVSASPESGLVRTAPRRSHGRTARRGRPPCTHTTIRREYQARGVITADLYLTARLTVREIRAIGVNYYSGRVLVCPERVMHISPLYSTLMSCMSCTINIINNIILIYY